jgi:hypothetical protein
MPVRSELVLRLPNSPGALSGVCALLAASATPVVAMSLGTGGVLRLVVDNPVRAVGALREHHHQVEERPVLVSPLSADVASAQIVLDHVARAGVNVEYAYTGRADSGQALLLVMGVDAPERAATQAGL